MLISVSSQTTLNNAANNFVFALYDASAPAVLLESQAPAKPYGNPIQVTFNYNCLSGHVYIIKLWESADTTPSGVVRNSFSQSVQSNTSTITLKMDEYLEADVTPSFTSGTTSYSNTDWAGWEYSIERIGSGTMVPDSTSDTTPNYSVNPAGGFNLVQTGDVFQPNEKFVVRFIPQVTTGPTEQGTPSSVFAAGQIITADKTLTSADSGQALFIQSSTTKISITLPPLSGISDYTFFYIFSNGGQHKNAVFNTSGSDKIQYTIFSGTNQVNQICLGQNETMRIFKAFGVWNVENDLHGVERCGEILYNYMYTPLNTLPLIGQLVNRADYPRLWNYVQNITAVVTDTQWNSAFTVVDGITFYTNKGFFSSGDGSTTFRLPFLPGMVLKGADASVRLPGSFEMDAIIDHQAEETIGLLPTSVFGQGGTVRKIGSYNGPYTSKTDLTGHPSDSNGNLLVRVGSENKIRTIGAFALIRI